MEKFTNYLLTGLICIVAAGQFVQVVTRYVLEIPVMGLEESMLYPTIWLYILGAVNASREDTHIRANVLEIFLETDKAKSILSIISEILSILIGLWLLSWAWDFAQYSWRVWKESPTLFIPTFYSDVALCIGMVLMILFTSIHLIKHIKAAMAGDEEKV